MIADHLAIPGRSAEESVAGIHPNVVDPQSVEREIFERVREEQRRIGEDLHDGLGQELTGLGFLAGELADTLQELLQNDLQERSLMSEPSPGSLAGCGVTARKLVDGLDRALRQVRDISRGLIPVDACPDGLWVALEELARTTTARTRIRCDFSGNALINESSTASKLYRIAQEAVTNAIRHSGASLISVDLLSDEHYVILRISDNGIGFCDSTASTGLGLPIMFHRAKLIGAKLTIDRTTNGGTMVTCTIEQGQTP